MWRRFWARGGRMAPEHRSAVAAYRALPAVDRSAPIDKLRLVVVDVETSGLDPAADRLLAIGAVALRGRLIHLEETFAVTLAQEAASTSENILVHGITGTEQTRGVEPAAALARWLAYAGSAPLVAFNAWFDRTAIERAIRSALGTTLTNVWLDLAALAPAVMPELAERPIDLDEWTARLGIGNVARHNALADALATAQLLQVALARAAAAGIATFDDLTAAADAQRWLARARRR